MGVFWFKYLHSSQMKRKTIYTLFVIGLALSFVVTPLGDFCIELLNKWVAQAPTIINAENRGKIESYNWKLKDAKWDYFNFSEAKGQVVFINFWASWNLPSKAQLDDIQTLYNKYKDKVTFYIITDEERTDPEDMMVKKGYTFPITYQIIGEPSPIALLKPSGTYILDKNGIIVVHQTAISDWDNEKVYELLDDLLNER